MSDKTTQEREAFEAWRRRTTKMDPDGAVALDGMGDDAGYANKITRVMHIAWMARAASTPSALPVEGAGWQPIETAPKDESVLIAASPDWVFEARQDLNDVAGEQVWQWVKPDGTPLHANLIPLRWQPMPTFPDSVPEQAAGRRLTDAEREAIYNAWQDDDLILWDAYAEGRKDEAEARPYGPDNPPPLRRDGESVKDYRIRCGWDKPAKEVARTEDCPATCWIEVVQGSTGPALCIGDDSGSHRLAGPKTGGGGTTTHRFRVRIDELVREAKALAARGVEE